MPKPSLADLMPDADDEKEPEDGSASDGPSALANFLDSIGVPPPEDMEKAFEDFKNLMTFC